MTLVFCNSSLGDIMCFLNFNKPLGESMDMGNTFWQADLGKTKKTYLDRGFIKPSTEVLIPRPRVNKALDRGFL